MAYSRKETLEKMEAFLAKQFDKAATVIDGDSSGDIGLGAKYDNYGNAVETVTGIINAYTNVIGTLENT